MRKKLFAYTAAKPQTRYVSAGRSSLLYILLFSVINIFAIPLSNSYFVFSSYFSQMASFAGAAVYIVTENIAMPIAFGVLALVLLVPYLLCYIFAPRHVGWMIGATALFGVETILAVGDMLIALPQGDTSFLLDGVFHVIILVMLITACVDGARRRRLGLSLIDPMDGVASEDVPPQPIADPTTEQPGESAPAAEASEPTAAHSEAVEQELSQRDRKWE